MEFTEFSQLRTTGGGHQDLMEPPPGVPADIVLSSQTTPIRLPANSENFGGDVDPYEPKEGSTY